MLASLLLVSCDNFLDIQPTGKVIAKTYDEYRALITDVYNNFPDDRSLTTLRTDEMTLDPSVTTAEDLSSYLEIWTWQDVAQDENTASYSWRRFYHNIYIANYIIEHERDITEGTTAEIKQLVGEAYMMRAYSHFILVNMFGKPYTKCDPTTTLAVPLSTEADVDKTLSRSTVGTVYTQIVNDIEAAKTYLNVDEWEAQLRYRFNTLSADALEARVRLYMGDWTGALKAAKAVVEAHPSLENLTSSTFTMPDYYLSNEAIVCLEQVMKSAYKGIGMPNVAFIQSYRTGDMRKSRFFKAQTSRLYTLTKGGDQLSRSTFRSAEFYLTAAEAAARLNDKEMAMEYLKPIIETRYMTALQPTIISELQEKDADQLVDAILDERAHELCFEGHRWFDLRRTTQPEITKAYNGVTYTLAEGDSRYTMPIPSEAISANPSLGEE